MKNVIRFVLILCILPLVPFATAQAPVVSDAYTLNSSGDMSSNFGSANILLVGAGASSFLQFSLSRYPAGLTSTSLSKATLRLFINGVTSSGAFDVYEANGPWSESAITFDNQPGLGRLIASGVVVSAASANQFQVVDVTSAVQDWLVTPSSNYGLVLVSSANSTLAVSFDSKEAVGNPNLRAAGSALIYTGHEAQIQIDYTDQSVQDKLAALQQNNQYLLTQAESYTDSALAPYARLDQANVFTGNPQTFQDINALGYVNAAGVNGAYANFGSIDATDHINVANFINGGAGFFQHDSTALMGLATNSIGYAVGVEGNTSSPNGSGVFGVVSVGSPTPNGGNGVVGAATATTGWATGVLGSALSPQAVAVVADNEGGGTAAKVRTTNPDADLLEGIVTPNNTYQGVFHIDGHGTFVTIGNVTANAYFGDGSRLTNVTAVDAAHASDSDQLGGVPAMQYARLDLADAFAGNISLNGDLNLAAAGSAVVFPDGSRQTTAATGSVTASSTWSAFIPLGSGEFSALTPSTNVEVVRVQSVFTGAVAELVNGTPAQACSTAPAVIVSDGTNTAVLPLTYSLGGTASESDSGPIQVVFPAGSHIALSLNNNDPNCLAQSGNVIVQYIAAP